MSDTTVPVPAIFPAMSAVMDEIDAIGKDSKNKQQGFSFRGIDAAYNTIHPLLAKHKIFTIPRSLKMVLRENRTTARGGNLTNTIIEVEYDFVSGVDGSKITAGPINGEAMDSGDKGAAKCLSIAHKYVLFQTFCIPTGDGDDPDLTAHDVLPPGAVPAAPTGLPPGFPQPVAPAPVAPPQPTPPEPPSTDDKLTVIPDAESAEEVAALLINIATSMHSSSIASLHDFWMKNKKPIDLLDTSWNPQYQKVKAAFTELKNKLMEQPKNV